MAKIAAVEIHDEGDNFRVRVIPYNLYASEPTKLTIDKVAIVLGALGTELVNNPDLLKQFSDELKSKSDKGEKFYDSN